MPRCKAPLKNGDQCRNNAIRGGTSCYIKSHGSSQAAFLQRFLNRISNHWAVTLLALLLAIVPLVLYLQDKEQKATSGVLSPQPGWRKIAVGGVLFFIGSKDGSFLKDGNERLLSVKTGADDKLLVSALIRNKNGELMAELKNNEWSLNKGGYYDRNYTPDALEVVDRYGKVALQVVLFSGVVHVAATFRCRNGWSVTLAPLGDSAAVIEPQPPQIEPMIEIRQIFKYPSELHFGEMPGLDDLRRAVPAGKQLQRGAYGFGDTLDLCAILNGGDESFRRRPIIIPANRNRQRPENK